MHRKNASFKIFVVVIPKAGLAGASAAKPSFGMTPTIEFSIYCVVSMDCIFFCRCHTRRRNDGALPTDASFDNDKGLKICIFTAQTSM